MNQKILFLQTNLLEEGAKETSIMVPMHLSDEADAVLRDGSIPLPFMVVTSLGERFMKYCYYNKKHFSKAVSVLQGAGIEHTEGKLYESVRKQIVLKEGLRKLFEDNNPTDQQLYDDLMDLARDGGDEISRVVGGEEVSVEAPNDGAGFNEFPSANASAWVVQQYNRLGGDWDGTADDEIPIYD